MNTQYKSGHRQQGIALVIFAASMALLIGVAGLALDVSHAMLDDSRLQNAMDACALSGAQVMMDTTGTSSDRMSAARTAAQNTLLDNRGAALASIQLGDIDVDFSETLEDPFTASVADPRYVRCAVDNHSVTTQLARIFGINTLGLNVTAVAGAIPITTCNVAPLLVCGDPTDPCEAEASATDSDPDSCYGFNVYREDGDGNPTNLPEEKCYMKNCPPGANCSAFDDIVGENCGLQSGAPTGGGDSDVSAGNFQFLDMTCISGKTGKNCIKEVFEQGGGVIPGGCPVNGSLVTTEPGNAASISDSYNTIFNGPNPDSNALNPIFYSQYRDGNPDGNGRRELTIIVGDCENPIVKGGKTQVPVLTSACFFATEPSIKTQGKPVMWGQFVGECVGNGVIEIDPDAFDTFKIVLYKDHSGPDS